MAIAGAVASIGFGVYSIIDAKNQKKKSLQELNDFKRQDLVNPFTSLPINTQREEFQRDAALSSQATSTDALRRGGTRSVLAGVPRLQESTNALNNSIFASIDEKAAMRDAKIAEAEFRNQQTQERREEQALFGLGNAYQTARQDMVTGITNTLQGGLALASAIDPEGGLTGTNDPLANLFRKKNPQTTTGNFNQTTPNISPFQQTLIPRFNGNGNQFVANNSSLFDQPNSERYYNPFITK